MSYSVNELLVADKVSTYLTDKWEEQTGINPNIIAAKVLHNEQVVKLVSSWMRPIGMGSLAFAILFLCATFAFALTDLLGSSTVGYVAAAVGVVCGTIDMTVSFVYKTREYELFPTDACGFSSRYRQLAEWSGSVSGELPLAPGSLRLMAEKILSGSAANAIRAQVWAQAMKLSDDDELRLREAELAWRKETRKRYTKLLEWDLVPALGVSGYFKGAGKYVAQNPLWDY
ncbi:MAG: hypothetical protein WDN10_05405 [bacterium]